MLYHNTRLALRQLHNIPVNKSIFYINTYIEKTNLIIKLLYNAKKINKCIFLKKVNFF